MTQQDKQASDAGGIDRDDQELRSDVRKLADLLGQSLVRQEGQDLLDLVESVRREVRSGGAEEILKNLDVKDSVQLVRAFNAYFNLANVAEQVHRARVLSEEREEKGSWISRAVDNILKAQSEHKDFTQKDMTEWMQEFSVRPVFTAHPTEAARRSVLSKLGIIAELLDDKKSNERERGLAEAVDLLWQTDELRLGRPEPLDEAMNALYYLDDLFVITVPTVLDEFKALVRCAYYCELSIKINRRRGFEIINIRICNRVSSDHWRFEFSIFFYWRKKQHSCNILSIIFIENKLFIKRKVKKTTK